MNSIKIKMNSSSFLNIFIKYVLLQEFFKYENNVTSLYFLA